MHEEDAMTTIRIRPNGPYVIEGDDVQVTDWNGTPYRANRQPIALCRCGASAKKPFCDGSHAKVGFQASTPADPPVDH